MRDLAARANRLVDRLGNRLIWSLASRSRTIETDVPLVTFTFDDVPDTALTRGAAILESHGVHGTFYIAGGLSGRVEADRTLISSSGCRELEERGHEIGCHTFAHRSVRSYGSALSQDLDRNGQFLKEAQVRRAPTNFAFPYNAAWPIARKTLKARYATCRGAGEAINRHRVDPWMLKSVEIRQPEEHARGLTRWVDDVVARPGWLIFFTHDIADRPTPHGCRPDTFDRLVEYTIRAGCRVITVADAVRRFGWETGR